MLRSAFVVLIACGCRTSEPLEQPPPVEVAYYAAIPSTKLDVLLQIDNSPSDLQDSFARALPTLLDRIGDLDLHIGVVSSDLGTSASTGDPAATIGTVGQGGCAGYGDDGMLQTRGAPVTDTYVIDEADGLGGRRRNYTGDLPTVLGQMVRLGYGGCGFEQPLAATTRALAHPANVGFSRTDANLLVVMVMDEDDCSATSPELFGPESAELGSLQSFRCTRFGVVCDEPIDSVGPKTNCRPREDSPYVDGIAPFVDAMHLVRGDAARVAVTAIAGPPSVVVEESSAPNGGAPNLSLAASCSWVGTAGLDVAAPAVRIAAVIDELAPNSSFSPACSADFLPAVRDIARVADGLRGVTCLDLEVLGPAPACNVTVESPAGERPLPLCSSAGNCFEIVDDAAACGDRPRLVVHLASPAADQRIRVRCAPQDSAH